MYLRNWICFSSGWNHDDDHSQSLLCHIGQQYRRLYYYAPEVEYYETGQHALIRARIKTVRPGWTNWIFLRPFFRFKNKCAAPKRLSGPGRFQAYCGSSGYCHPYFPSCPFQPDGRFYIHPHNSPSGRSLLFYELRLFYSGRSGAFFKN